MEIDWGKKASKEEAYQEVTINIQWRSDKGMNQQWEGKREDEFEDTVEVESTGLKNDWICEVRRESDDSNFDSK